MPNQYPSGSDILHLETLAVRSFPLQVDKLYSRNNGFRLCRNVDGHCCRPVSSNRTSITAQNSHTTRHHNHRHDLDCSFNHSFPTFFIPISRRSQHFLLRRLAERGVSKNIHCVSCSCTVCNTFNCHIVAVLPYLP